MGSELSDFSTVARGLVLGNGARIFPDIRGSIEVLDVKLGRRKFIRDDQYHCRLTIHYRADGSTKSLRMWLNSGRSNSTNQVSLSSSDCRRESMGKALPLDFR